jgi:oligopeptide transport system permease protein
LYDKAESLRYIQHSSMISILVKRFVHGVIVLWAVASLTFILLRLAPGGPFDSERKLPPEIIANLEAKYHLNEPVLEQYSRYLAGVARGDLGPSYKYLDRGVTEIIADTLPTSALLGALAVIFAVLVSFPLGLFAAYYRESVIDRFCLFLATLGISCLSGP